MFEIQTVGLQLGRIDHTLGIQIHVGLDVSASFCCHKISLIMLTIGLHMAFHAYTFRNAHVSKGIFGEQGCQEIQIVGLCLHIYIGNHMVQICRMGHISRSVHIQCTRQLHMEPVELGLPHVS